MDEPGVWRVRAAGLGLLLCAGAATVRFLAFEGADVLQVTVDDLDEVREYLEAYSWGVGEDESGDGLYCGFEGVVGAAVIGV